MAKERVSYTSERTLEMYNYLRNASWSLNKSATVDELGRTYLLAASIMFSAFCMEAYLNHVGSAKIETWEPRSRICSAKDKLKKVSKKLGYALDLTKEPFSEFDALFRFRKALAHAKTTLLEASGQLVLEEDERPPKPLADWEKLITPEGAEHFLAMTKVMITELHKHFAAGTDPFSGELTVTAIRRGSDSDAGWEPPEAL